MNKGKKEEGALIEVDLETMEVMIEAEGFAGEGCFKALEWLEKAFPKGKITKKKEYRQKGQQKKVVKIQQ
jgi:uncharacterized protein Smg (DUF494 family)